MQKQIFAAGALVVTLSVVVMATGPQQMPQGPPPIKHTYDLDTSYIPFPLAESERAYGRIDGARLKQFANEITGVSRKSRDDGERYWGRIAGTKYDDMIEGWTEQKFQEFGLQDVRRQYFDLPPQFFPTDWALTASGGGETLAFKTVRPAGRVTTPAGGLELEPVWVGLGTESDFAGRDVRGKLVIIHSIPTPAVISHSAAWSNASNLAAQKGAAAILINLAILGTNWEVQMSAGVPDIPAFSMGTEDTNALRALMERGPVKVKVQLDGETRNGLRDANVWGTLPGTTDEEILLIAHHDGYFEAANDNASGMAVMVGLAEYFSKIPQAQRRRTLKFVTTSGHHAGSLGVRWMHENQQEALGKTVLMFNCEHVSATQTYIRGPVVRKSNGIAARRWWVYGSDTLASISHAAWKTFGVTTYHDMEERCCGDSSAISRDIPNVVLMESPVFYHTNQDIPALVPNEGLQAVARSYAKIIDEANKHSRQALALPAPSTAGQR